MKRKIIFHQSSCAIKKWVLIQFVLFLTFQVFGFPQSIVFEPVELFKGQKSITINKIDQDTIGFVWFATNQGIFRYDGYNFKRYHLHPDHSISRSNTIVQLTIDPKGNIWYLYKNLLNRYNPVTDTFIEIQLDSLTNKHFYAFTSDSQSVWIGTSSGKIYRYFPDTEKTETVEFSKNIQKESRRITDFQIIDSSLIIISDFGIFNYNIRTRTIRNISEEIANFASSVKGFPRSLLISDNNDIYFGSHQMTLNRISDGKLSQYKIGDLVGIHFKYSRKINSMCFDNHHNIWIASGGAGISLFNPQNNTVINSISHPDFLKGISFKNFQEIFIDNSGNIWLCAKPANGLYKSKLSPFQMQNYETIVNPDDSCSNDYITNIAELHDGKMIFSIDEEGFCLFNPQNYQFDFYKNNPQNDNSLQCNDINTIYVDNSGIVWLGTIEGLIRFDPLIKTFNRYYPEPDYPNYTNYTNNQNIVWAIHKFTETKLWIGTNQYLYEFDKRTKTFNQKYTIAENKNAAYYGKGSAAIRCLETIDNNLLVGTPFAGLFLFDVEKKQFIDLHIRKDWGNNTIALKDIFKDSHNRIWLSTGKSGFYSYHENEHKLTSYYNLEGMLSNNIHHIFEDSLSNLWVCSSNGVVMFNPESETFTPFTVEDNFTFYLKDRNDRYLTTDSAKVHKPYQRAEVTGYTSRDGTVYFAGANGYTQLSLNFLNNKNSHKIHLLSFKIFNEEVPFDQPIYSINEIRLKYSDYIFSFEFMFTDLSDVKRNKYAYWLKGFEKGWQYTGSNNSREYINIPPGRYTMMVKACNPYGIWTAEPLEIDLIITPPFWQTWWFRISAALSIFGLIGLVFWLRIRRIQKQKNLLETQVQQRTRELNESNDQLRDEIRFRRKAEEELRKSEEEYRDLFENAYDVIWISDLDGTIQAVNHYFMDLLGYSKEEIIGSNLLDYISPGHRFRALLNYYRFKQKHRLECEINFQTKNNGTRILWMKIRAIKDNHNIIGIHGIGRDTTELKRTQAELQEAERAKRESIKQLTLKIAHEIKNPLASITSSAQLVASSKDTRDKPKIQRHMSVINKSVNTCNQVIRELHAFTHKPEMNLKILKIGDLVNSLQISAETRLASYPNMNLVMKKELSNTCILGDKFRLEQAFMNLINNAIEAMSETGTLTIHSFPEGELISIAISDTGCGMSSETLENLFKPFYTSKSAGFGLGMPVVKDIISAHNALIDVQSEVNKGTTFTIRFKEQKCKEN